MEKQGLAVGETDAKFEKDETIVDVLSRLFGTLPPEERPTRAEEITALRMMISATPNVELHKNGLETVGLRAAAVDLVIQGVREQLWSRLAYLSTRPPVTLRGDNVVELRQRFPNVRESKKG